MTKLQRYFFFLLITPFLMITIGLALLGILTQSLTQLDLLIERGQSPFVLLYISFLALPQFMAVVAPIAIFATICMVYSRLYSENEIVVAFASGQNQWQIANPIIRLSVVTAILVLFINVFVQPHTHKTMREEIFKIRSDMATTLVREGQFRETVSGLTVFTRKIERNGDLQGLIISDTRSPEQPVTYLANVGAIVKIRNKPAISLENGSIQRKDKFGKVEIYGFSQYVLELEGFDNEEKEIFFKPSDRYTHTLLKPDMTNYWDRSHVGTLLAEFHKRLASPLNTIAAAFLGIYAILGSAYSRRGYGGAIVKSSGGLLVLLLFGSAIQDTIEKSPELNILQYLIPILIILFVAHKLHMFKNWNKELNSFEVIL